MGDWLHGEIIEFDEHVDLLGLDWGAGHVLGVAAAYPESIRSWAVDVAGPVHPDYVWRDAANGWQTPEVGEQMIDTMLEMSVADRTAADQGPGPPSTSIRDPATNSVTDQSVRMAPCRSRTWPAS